MELSRFTDYALRVLIYAASREGEKITLAELTQVYRISHHHLVKIVHFLGKEGYLHNRRGRSGGIVLGRKAEEIGVGEVIRKTETHLNLVECFDQENSFCRISPACRLRGIVAEARDAFLKVLDSYTVADLSANRKALLRLLLPQSQPNGANLVHS